MNASIFTLFSYRELMKRDNYTITTGGFDCIFYKDLQIISTMQDNNDYINIYTKKIDKKTIEKLSSIIKNKKIYKVDIYEGKNEINIEFLNDEEINVNVSGNEELLLRTYNYLSSKYSNVNELITIINKSVQVKGKNIRKEFIKREKHYI